MANIKNKWLGVKMTREEFKTFLLGYGIVLEELGKQMTMPVVDDETGELITESYSAYHYELTKEVKGKTLQAISIVDTVLVEWKQDNIENLIQLEIMPWVEGMLLEEEKAIKKKASFMFARRRLKPKRGTHNGTKS